MIKKAQKTNKELKEALKNEVSPLLIGLRNEIKETNSAIKALADKQVPVNELEIIVDGQKITALKGKDGDTPVADKDYMSKETAEKIIADGLPKKGIHYFTDSEIKDFLKQVTPVKGVDYKDGENATTPVRGVDYFTDSDVKDFLKRATPIKGIHYNDGVTTVIEKEGTKVTGVQIRNLLENLTGTQKLSVKAIKGLDDHIRKILGQSGASSGGYAIGASGDSRVKTITFTLDTPTSTDVFPIFSFSYPVTIVSVKGTVRGGTSNSFNIELRTPTGLNSSGNDILASDITATQSGVLSSTFNGTYYRSIPANSHLVYASSGLGGTVNQVVIQINYTVDN